MTMDPKNRGLGRGLNALFEDEETGFTPGVAVAPSSEAARGRMNVGIDQLQPSKFQPRKLFEEDSLQELASSIKAHGVLQPILVRQHKTEDGQYEIIAGERRWRAAQMAQLHEVPVVIRKLTDVEALEIALIENLQREDLNPVDEAMGYKKLMEEHDYTQEKLAAAMGKSRPHIANMVRLLTLPDVVLAFLERGDLSSGHARALIGTEDPVALAKEIVAGSLSVRQTEELVAQSSDKPQKQKASAAGALAKGADTIALERELENKLGMRVSIDSKSGQKGKVTIEWKSLDQLDEILRKISG